MPNNLKIEYVSIDDIKTYPNNAKLHPAEQVEQIKESIKEFGFNDPIAIDKDNVIIEGHGRYIACKELGIKEVPIIRLNDLSDEQKRAYMLVHNKLTMNTDFDIELLNDELDNIFDIDMSKFDFDLDYEVEEEKEIIEDNVPEVPEEPKSKLGDIYQLGNHRLMCGDSTDEAQVSNLLGGEVIDLSFTSPPYNTANSIGYESDSKYKNDSDNKDSQEYLKFLLDFTSISIKNSKYTFVNIQSVANNKIALIDYLYELKEYYNDTMIWNKGYGQPAMAKNVMNSAYEYIHIFSERPTRAIGTKEFRGNVPNILNIDKQSKNQYNQIHNATFSLEFVSYFINHFCNENEKVLDLFGGTGSTLIACEQLNRKCYTMELDPLYVDVIIERWENYTGKKAVKIC